MLSSLHWGVVLTAMILRIMWVRVLNHMQVRRGKVAVLPRGRLTPLVTVVQRARLLARLVRVGTCTCPGGLTDCGGGNCFDTSSDSSHCGSCMNVCNADEICQNYQCICAPPTELCNGVCTNTMTDKNNCGTCTHSCMGNKQCVNGTCQLSLSPIIVLTNRD